MIHVAVAAVVDTRNHVLLAQRPEGKHLGGFWEFPGGKVEPGETVVDALRRELQEEVALAPVVYRPLIRIHHAYPDKTVLLDVWRVEQFSGMAQGREGQPLAWVPVEELKNWMLPPADESIVTALSLPDTYLVTPDLDGSGDRFLHELERALRRGVRFVQLRSVGASEGDLAVLRRAADLCRAVGARVLSNSRHAAAIADYVDGVHLTSRDLWNNDPAGTQLGALGLVGASCHDERDIRRAQDLGVNFVTLSPVAHTRSHPQTAALGWDRFNELAEAAAMPVYALGGMTLEHLATSWRHGGQGIAAIRGLWPDADPSSTH